ncbi:hypothetical protein CF336_g576 [Tilletia laevis]|uniref:Poly A polymerase head domain-containing protein n=1 Tax=Tilletia caries TaxID=13290 RepID=A0A177V0X9_9BASI|nr:hypothetical protein CF336_g576 [Tilletia laevis]KAE8208619.1 hypothetical protein CF335_g272 [Tilletia laevis]KAE8263767.1 hypothetical protein A4X03_0g1442 [Tilletia caries]
MAPSASPPRLQLTEAEANITQVIRHTCEWITTHKPQTITIRSQTAGEQPVQVEVVNEHTYSQIQNIGNGRVEARIAGGWVRDKLLNKDSDDLDVSLSSTTGFTFAHFLAAYLASPQFAQSDLAARIPSPTTSSIAKIAANPEQSKNLETATANVFGLSLDFVNLRKEVYEGDTRIPIMSFGTAKEDAERRDITINSLFYNVHTEQVEDLTGMGLDDLASGIIRTPLPPHITFLDDPLRVLRCIRFAARFHYVVHPDIIACLSDQAYPEFYTEDKRVFGRLPGGKAEGEKGRSEEVDKARVELKELHLRSKVSRERFGIEIDKMMRGPDPLRAITLITALDLYSIVFHPPHSSLSSHYLPFDLDRDSPALVPNTTSVQIASQITETNAEKLVRGPGANVLGFEAGSRLDAVWECARGSGSGGGGEVVDRMDEVREGDPSSSSHRSDDRAALAHALAHSSTTNTSWTALLPPALIQVMLDPEQRARLFLAAALLPMERIGVLEAVGGGGKGGGKKKVKLLWAAESVVSQGLKLGNRQAKDPISALFRARALIETVLDGRETFVRAKADAGAAKGLGLPAGVWPDVEVLGGEGEGEEEKRSMMKFGLLLRQPSLTSSANHVSLAPALLFALVSRLAHASLHPDADGGKKKAEAEEEIVRGYVWFWEQCTQSGLLERAEEKPVLDGNQIKSILNFHPGPLTPRIQTAILAWQLAPPSPSSQGPEHAEAAAWLKGAWEAGGVVGLEARKGVGAGKKKGRGEGEGEGSRKRQKSEEGAQ